MRAPKVEFESPSPHKINTLKPVPVAGFIINNKNFANTLPRFFHYRKPQIKRTKGMIYIEYYYRIPVELRKFYNDRKWERFRLREDINIRKDGREQYAEWWRDQVEESLKQGYNPFESVAETIGIEEIKETVKELNATDAILLFLEAWRKRGLEPASLSKYEKVANRLIFWLKRKSIPYMNVLDIQDKHIEAFLNDMKKEHGFSNREYNNHLDFTRTIFKFLVDKKHIPSTPLTGISKQKSKSTKHRYYDNASLEKIKDVLLLTDPYLYFACQVTYYACIRSDKELMNFKVGNINFEDNRILITGEGAKGSRARYIPLDENLKQLFIDREINKADPAFYVFGIKGKPSNEPFGKGFFSKRFRKVRKLAGLPDVFTVYGFKFTRVVHLKHDGLDDSSIMALTGHTDFTSYAKYLRNLGIEASPAKINKVSRKI